MRRSSSPACCKPTSMRAPSPPPSPGYTGGEQREEAVTAKAVRRQGVLSGKRRLPVVLGEGALRQAVGGPGVLAGQIRHLVQLAEEYPGLTVQILPFSAGAHAAAGSGSLAILKFPDAPSLGVVYLEALSGGVYLESSGGRGPLYPCVRAAACRRAQPRRQHAPAAQSRAWPSGRDG